VPDIAQAEEARPVDGRNKCGHDVGDDRAPSNTAESSCVHRDVLGRDWRNLRSAAGL
jgi:hypothetical protein